MVGEQIAQSKAIKYFLVAGILSLGITGCMKKDVFDPDSGKETGKDDGKVTLDDYFDFATSQTVQLKVDYGEECPKAYFEVYAENPLSYQEEGSQVVKRTDILHIASGFVNGAGAYDRSVTIPASVSEVYIYSPDFGVPQLYKADITNKAINAKISFDNEIDVLSLFDSRSVTGRAKDIPTNIPNTLGDWNSVGKPDYLVDDLKIDIDSKLKSYITSLFPESHNSLASPYISHDSDILIKETAKVWINYFGGNTSARSVFAYYCYRDGAPIAEIKKAVSHACVIFPNARGQYDNQEVLGNYGGVGTYLKYIDENGKLQDNVEDGFPVGTKIGFLIWNNGFLEQNEFTSNTFYSTESLNSPQRSHTAIFAAKSTLGKRYNVITMEDWKDTDYNDVAFIISSNPITAIEVPDAPDPDDDRTGTNNYVGLLGFEDNWPGQGDYDMNDVVVKYESIVTYNESNSILGITDNITLAWTGADFHNGFSYQVPFDLSLVNLNLPETSSTSADNVINVFNDAKGELGVSNIGAKDMPSHASEIQEKNYKISMAFKEPYPYGVTPPYNPFIRMGVTEVHLPNQSPTANANNLFPQDADISDGKTTFFICEDGFPFAIHMDARADKTMLDVDLKSEGTRIDGVYPKFADWAKTRDPKVKWW